MFWRESVTGKITSLLAPCEPWSSFRLDKSRAKVLFGVYQTNHFTFHKGMVRGKGGGGGGLGADALQRGGSQKYVL